MKEENEDSGVLVTCPQCGQINRIRERTESGIYRCASCSTPIPVAKNKLTAKIRYENWLIWGGIIAGIAIILCVLNIMSLSRQNALIQTERDVALDKAITLETQQKRIIEESTARVDQSEKILAGAERLRAEAEKQRQQIERELVRLGISEEKAHSICAPTTATGLASATMENALMSHLPTDNRLNSGSVLSDSFLTNGAKGKLTLDNGLSQDAFVKMINDNNLVASFYVRSGEKFTFDHISDGSYRLLYCTGYGWDADKRDFARGRVARRYDAPLNLALRAIEWARRR